jgi:hypothetical protein
MAVGVVRRAVTPHHLKADIVPLPPSNFPEAAGPDDGDLFRGGGIERPNAVSEYLVPPNCKCLQACIATS